MPKLVVMGATLNCNKGSKTCSLTPCMVNSIVTGPGIVASMLDHQVGDNILDFGDCDVAPKPCNPITPLPWDIVWTNALVGSAPPVTKESKLRCFKTDGAEITITYAGQETIELESSTSEDGDGGDSPVLPLLGMAGTAVAADGPLPVGDLIGLGLAGMAGGIALHDAMSSDDHSESGPSDEDTDQSDTRQLPERRGAARGDPHGSNKPSLQRRVNDLEKELARAKREGASKKYKQKLARSKENLQKELEDKRKGGTHWRRGK